LAPPEFGDRRMIVEFAGRDMKAAAGDDVRLKAERGASGVKPQYRAVEMAPDEIAAIAEAIQENRAAGMSYRDQALLCTGNERLGRMAAGLESLGIPILYLGSLFERDEIQELLSLPSMLTDRRAMGLVRVAIMPEFRLHLSEVAVIIALLKETEEKPLQWLGAIDGVAGLSAAAGSVLGKLRQALEGFDATSRPWTVFYALQRYLADFRTWYLILLGALAIVTMLFAPKSIWDMSCSAIVSRYFRCDECWYGRRSEMKLPSRLVC
jgi:hypothetical protein